MKMTKYKTVDAYIKSFPTDVQAGLKKMRAAVKKGAPKAEEKISYGMPGYKFNGMLLYFAAFKDHYSLFVPPSSDAGVVFKKELEGHRKTKATFHFPLTKAVPVGLIGRIARLRWLEHSKK